MNESSNPSTFQRQPNIGGGGEAVPLPVNQTGSTTSQASYHSTQADNTTTQAASASTQATSTTTRAAGTSTQADDITTPAANASTQAVHTTAQTASVSNPVATTGQVDSTATYAANAGGTSAAMGVSRPQLDPPSVGSPRDNIGSSTSHRPTPALPPSMFTHMLGQMEKISGQVNEMNRTLDSRMTDLE